jgi:hypothetical protein
VRHYMVNSKRVQRPKPLGGLGVLDLMKFNKALHLRWQWQKWSDPDKLSSYMPLEANATETALFSACTTMTLLGINPSHAHPLA